MGFNEKLRIAVLISGGGSNLEAIIQAVKQDEIPGTEVALVISSREDAFGVQRAQRHGIETVVIDPRSFTQVTLFNQAIIKVLLDYHIDLICLAGYLKKLGPELVDRFRGRILNIHPALLPK